MGWDNEAWEQIADYVRFWTPFDDRFRFRPSMDPATWPAIAEPPGSVTFDLSPIFARDVRGFGADKAALERLVLEALLETFADGTRLVALDWHHLSYWFWPHRQDRLGEPWSIEPFPDGDYHILLTEDLGQGTFGHPWEQTFCVFGTELAPRLVPRLSDWLPVKRTHPAPPAPC